MCSHAVLPCLFQKSISNSLIHVVCHAGYHGNIIIKERVENNSEGSIQKSFVILESGDTSNLTVVDALAAETGLAKTRIKDAMAKGAVWLTIERKPRRIRRAKSIVKPGNRIDIYYDPKVLTQIPPAPELVAEFDSYSVWNKPPGLLSSGTRYGDHCAINRWIERERKHEVFIIHRLDQYARGLMVVAHNKASAANLSAQFKDRTVEKHYQVIVTGCLPCDSDYKKIDAALDDKVAVSHYRALEQGGGLSLLKVKIETGRKHQIRRHLADIGYPVVGDRLYGNATSDGSNQSLLQASLQLSACYLAFDCPEIKKPYRAVRREFQLANKFLPKLL